MFKDKQSLPQAAPESEKPKEPEHCPTMAGTFHGYQPQWKNRTGWGETVNKRLFGLEGGEKWTDVPYVTVRGVIAIKLPDGREVSVGVPFPRHMPGILESIGMCGHEQAMALAWAFAAYVSSVGCEVEVRAEEYVLNYDIKAKRYEGKAA